MTSLVQNALKGAECNGNIASVMKNCTRLGQGGFQAWLISLAFIAVVACARAESRVATIPPHKAQPNIIFILADDLGYGDLGCYGQTKIKTPNLDQLAGEGMRFTSFYAGSTVCAPSRCALMTGLHTGHAWVRGNATVALRPEDQTVAEVLQQAGYRTGLIGKWGLGDENTTGVPQKKGFDEFVGYLDQVHAHDYYTDHLWRYAPATPFQAAYDGQITLFENTGGKRGLYTHDLFTTGALNFVRLNKPEASNRYRPFFLYLAYTIPHANDEEGQRTGNGMQVPSDAPYSNEPWPQVEKNKAAMISRMDTDVGRLLGRLQDLKIDSNTVVFFTSDNGPHKEGGVDPNFFQSSGPLRGIKRDLYEGGIRMPLIVRWPGHIKPGQTSDLISAFWDFLPTAAEIAQAKVPENLDGLSILPTLLGHTQTNQHQFLYWEFHERGFQQAVRMGDWKAVRPQAEEPLELYNLKTDLGEKNNVAAEHPEIVARIETYLRTARTENPRWPIKKLAQEQGAK
ncbi:Sulfatase [Verrucomicrobia bacterium]|nr:Sulfatase [Verrucomicrobiota bacterium]